MHSQFVDLSAEILQFVSQNATMQSIEPWRCSNQGKNIVAHIRSDPVYFVQKALGDFEIQVVIMGAWITYRSTTNG